MNNTTTATVNFDFETFAAFEDDFLIKMREEYFNKLIDMLGEAAICEILTDYIGLEESIKAVKNVLNKTNKTVVQPDPERFIKKPTSSVATEFARKKHSYDSAKIVLKNIIDGIPNLQMKDENAKTKKNQVVCKNYILSAIECADPDGKLTDLVLRIIVKIGWHEGLGVSLKKFVPLFKVLTLHRDKAEIVSEEMVRFLRQYDHISFMVNANQDERFISHLHIEDKMTLFLEAAICENLGLKPLGDDILQ